MRTPQLLALLALSACEFEPGPADCTMEARSSVSVTVTDAAGAPLSDAAVVYSVDGGAEQACEPMSGGAWVCGWEVSGVFQITASAEGYEAQSAEVEVGMTEDGCHVVGEVLELALAATCDPLAVPAAQVFVTDEAGNPVLNAEVRWSLTYADMAPQSCTGIDEQEFHCGYGQVGDITIEAMAPDLGPFTQDIVVAEGDCGPETVVVDAVLDDGV